MEEVPDCLLDMLFDPEVDDVIPDPGTRTHTLILSAIPNCTYIISFCVLACACGCAVCVLWQVTCRRQLLSVNTAQGFVCYTLLALELFTSSIVVIYSAYCFGKRQTVPLVSLRDHVDA